MPPAIIGAAAAYGATALGASTVMAMGAGLLGSVVAGKMIGGKDDSPALVSAAPTVEKATVMPEPDDAAVKAAKRRSIASQAARSGRASTILSDPLGVSDTLG